MLKGGGRITLCCLNATYNFVVLDRFLQNFRISFSMIKILHIYSSFYSLWKSEAVSGGRFRKKHHIVMTDISFVSVAFINFTFLIVLPTSFNNLQFPTYPPPLLLTYIRLCTCFVKKHHIVMYSHESYQFCISDIYKFRISHRFTTSFNNLQFPTSPPPTPTYIRLCTCFVKNII